MDTIQGQEIIQTYNSKNSLNSFERTFIVHKIIQHYLENDLKFNIKICREIAEEIISIFPSEILDTYFLQTSKKQPPKGKIWDRYQSRKKYMKKLSLTKRSLESRYDADELSKEKKDKIEKNESIRTELKYVRDMENFLAKWRETVAYRTNQIRSITLSESIKSWPLYESKQNSATLVSSYT